MNAPEHVFPLPEMEQHKLDEVKEEIVHPFSRRAHRFLGANAWTAIAISLAVGAVCGFALGKRG
jgi:ElaB/YqjD/DUF883 family membrane-anchored ribosome-binding protein